MQLLKKALLVFVLGIMGGMSPVFSQATFQEMMQDPNVNFYDVVRAAETYFQTHDRDAKGSGWKQFERWRYANEYKYFPSGNRANVAPDFAAKAYAAFLEGQASGDLQRLFQNGWEDLGPLRVDSITGHYAAGLGRIEDFYVQPSNPNRLYLGSRSGGFWKSLDGGVTWQGGATDFLVASGVNVMTVSPTNPDSILINVQNADNNYSHGIYRSINGGTSFNLSNFSPANVGFGGLGSNFRVYKIAYHPTIPNLVFVGTNKGLYRSTNNLATWTQVYSAGEFTQIAFHPSNPNIVYVLDTRGSSNLRDYVYRSTNAGATFSLSNQIPGNGPNSGLLSVSSNCVNCLYFASSSGVFISSDQGINFSFISNPAAGTGGFAVNDQDTSKMVIGYLDMSASTNGGRNFQQVTWWSLGSAQNGTGNLQSNFRNSPSYVHADLRNAKCINGNFYAGTDGYLVKSTDNGTTWSRLSEGTGVRENYRLGTSQSNHYRSICGSQDNGTSIRLKGAWLEFYGADGMEAIIHPLNDNWMISSLQYGGRRRTLDGGGTQGGATPSGQSGSGIASWVAPFVYDPNDHMTVFHFSHGVYKSTDFGTTWNLHGTPSGITNEITNAAIAENNSNIMVISSSEKIEKSVDGGMTFVSIKNNLPNGFIEDIAFDPLNDNVMSVVYGTYQNDGNKVYLTTNGGSSWTNITGNLQNMPLRSVVIDHSDSSYIYLGAEIGVYVKSMIASTWTLHNTALPNTAVLELEINNGSNTLKAATWGRGLWEYSLKDRLDFPAILTTSIPNLPTLSQPVFGSPQFVTSVISYAGNLSSVYVEWSANAPTFGNMIQMNNTVDSTWVSQTPLPNLSVGTKLYFKVFAVGANNDTSETYKFMYTIKPYAPCVAQGSSGTGSDYINLVQVNGYSNPSNQTYYASYPNSLVHVYQDSTYALQVGLNYAFSLDQASAWIDHDKDALFEPGEQISMSSYNASFQSFGTFTVPYVPAFMDTVVLRVRNSYNSTLNPCGTVAGEVEDYTLVRHSCNTSSTSQNLSQCGSYTWPANGVTYTNSGTYNATIPSVRGCDSTITLNLSILNPSAATLSAMACDSYFWPLNGTTYTTSGSFSTVLPNQQGCDSLVTLNLQVNSSANSSLVASACDLYQAPDGQVYTSSGSYTATVQTSQGCDSVISIQLTVTTIDSSISVSGSTLTALNATGAYQWLDCLNGYTPIPSATSQSFSPSTGGQYAVQITQGLCVDTSSCATVVTISNNQPEMQQIHLYPNPSKGQFNLELARVAEEITVRVTDISGKVLIQSTYHDQSVVELQLGAAAGMYIVEVVADGVRKEFKLLRE